MKPVQQGFILTRHSYDTPHGCELVFWLATPSGPVRLITQPQRPVLFVAQSEQTSVQHYLTQRQLHAEFKALPLKNFSQQPITACYFKNLSDHRNATAHLQEMDITPLEADIRLDDRYLMERFIYGSACFTGKVTQRDGYLEYRDGQMKRADYHPELSVLSLDVECSRHGELYSVGLYGHGMNRVIMVGDPQDADTDILWVEDERQLLEQLIQSFSRLDPDIIIGWAVVNFDFHLLMKRAELHGIAMTIGRGNRRAVWRNSSDGNQGFMTIPGRVALDGIDALKSATYQFDSFSLESVAQALLGRGKLTENVARRLETIERNFRHNKPALAAYNLEDCRLVWDIFENTRLLDFLCLRSQITGLELDRRGGSVAAFTNFYLPKLHRAGYIAPNLPKDAVADSPGGYVMESQPGLYEHVLVLDFKSLYPAIIRTFKIDPMGLVEGLQHPDEAIEGFRGGRFSRTAHFLPQIIEDLWQQRDLAKQEQDAARSQAIKILMNSFYGVLGSTGCRFFDPRLASSITMRGHAIMQTSAQWIETEGYRVIYGDTDSLFVHLGDKQGPDIDADAIGRQLTLMVNRRWKEQLKDQMQLDSCLELEYETHYRRFLMPTIRGSDTGSKKRYAGLCEDRLIFKGLETVRSDWTQLAKSFQTELYQLIFNDQDPRDLIRRYVEETRSGQRDSELVYRKRLRRKLNDYTKNIPPQVRAARIADEHNRRLNRPEQYQNKGTIAYLLTVNGPEPEDYLTSQIDYQHYIDKQLQPVAEAILPFINLSFDQVISDQFNLFG